MLSFLYTVQPYVWSMKFPCIPKDMDLKTIVGQIATVCTIAVFLAGIEICQKIWKKQSTIDVSALPFLCGLVSCSFWLRYGLLVRDSALIVVNITGTSLQTLYLIWYARYCINKYTFLKQLLCAFLAIGLLFYNTTYNIEEEDARYLAGIASCSAGVLFMASPLSSLALVLRTKNVENLPFAMILSTFIMAALWVFYGILTQDKFVQIPNLLGALLALAQLSLFVIYPNKKPYYELSSGI